MFLDSTVYPTVISGLLDLQASLLYRPCQLHPPYRPEDGGMMSMYFTYKQIVVTDLTGLPG